MCGVPRQSEALHLQPCQGMCPKFVHLCFQVSAWSEGCLITRAHRQGRCSWCKQRSIHFIHVAPLFGQQLHECSACGHITKRCSRCPDFAKAELGDGVSCTLCALCSHEILDWDETISLIHRVRSMYCSKCLTLQVHRPGPLGSSVSEDASKQVYECSGCSRCRPLCSCRCRCYCVASPAMSLLSL
jgi:hypothetical protein